VTRAGLARFFVVGLFYPSFAFALLAWGRVNLTTRLRRLHNHRKAGAAAGRAAELKSLFGLLPHFLLRPVCEIRTAAINVDMLGKNKTAERSMIAGGFAWGVSPA
jgi:hypothetical protein